jgi:hypothetical protein
MTYVQLVNAVLRRLRETQVSTVQSSGDYNTYAALIGDFVNEAKEQVENAWSWSALHTNLSISTVSGTNEYVMAGTRHRFTPETAYNVTKKWEMLERTNKEIQEWLLFAPQSGSPVYYNFTGVNYNDDNVKVTVFPTPSSVETLRFTGTVRPKALSADTDTLIVPSRPVILLATAMGMEERGEDNGQQSINAYRLAQAALADEIALDAGRQTENTIWYPA